MHQYVVSFCPLTAESIRPHGCLIECAEPFWGVAAGSSVVMDRLKLSGRGARAPRSELFEFIRGGQLLPGTHLYHPARIYREREVDAIVERGGIRVKGKLFASPSAAAEAVVGSPVNGWFFWRLKASGKRLTSLRELHGS